MTRDEYFEEVGMIDTLNALKGELPLSKIVDIQTRMWAKSPLVEWKIKSVKHVIEPHDLYLTDNQIIEYYYT